MMLRTIAATGFTALCASAALADSHIATRDGAVGDWSHFCDGVCWVATNTYDHAAQIIVARIAPGDLQVSVSKPDGTELTQELVELSIGCVNEPLIVSGSAAYTRNGKSDRAVLQAMFAEDMGTILVFGETRRFSTFGLANVLNLIGATDLSAYKPNARCQTGQGS